MNSRRSRLHLHLYLLLLCAAGVQGTPAQSTPVEVDTQWGRIRGETTAGGIHQFRGVPYAAPPVGNLRWCAPQPHDPWTGVRDARSWGASAPQPQAPEVFDRSPVPMSEDCLYLNIWTPGLDTAGRPVLMWIHGGGLTSGVAADTRTGGETLAANGNVVVVSINYRLGALGFLAHDALADPVTGAMGNWGLLDQIAALEWIGTNIRNFGGDPENITIFGQSAGGMSCGALLATPFSRRPDSSPKFAKAIVQSGGALARTLAEARVVTEDLCESLLGSRNVTPQAIANLRARPWLQIVSAQTNAMPIWYVSRGGALTIDGVVLPREPLALIRSGSSRGIHLLAGSQRDESALWTDEESAPTAAELKAMVSQLYARRSTPGQLAQDLIDTVTAARVARGDTASPHDLQIAIESELFFRDLSNDLLDAHVSHTPEAWCYVHTRLPFGRTWIQHGAEVEYVFGNLRLDTTDERAFSTLVQAAWTSFARNGDPSIPVADSWTRHTTASRDTMMMDLTPTVVSDPYGAERTATSDPLVDKRFGATSFDDPPPGPAEPPRGSMILIR